MSERHDPFQSRAPAPSRIDRKAPCLNNLPCLHVCQETGASCSSLQATAFSQSASGLLQNSAGRRLRSGEAAPCGQIGDVWLWPDSVVRATEWLSWPPGVGHGSLAAQASRRRVSTALRNSSTPSAGTLPRVQVGWLVGWLKASGWGIRPRIRPVGSVRPAIPSGEPLGLAG